ncbi:MAG: phosphatase PAP2 family protein [Alphaproteobacteria bacterium]|nr:phosphatase PAP2 family protein [Alphaproteobacteria bacterium]
MESLLHDISWVLPLRSDAATIVFNAFTYAGYTPFFLVLLPLGYWLWDKAMFTRVAFLIGFVGLTNTFLKELFMDPRPPIAFALDGRVGESFGFPSGHAQIAVALWFWLAMEIKRSWAWIAAAIIAAGVCFSRIYLGVHDVEDVLGGAALGVACIFIFKGLTQERAIAEAHPAAQLLGIAVIAPVAWVLWPRDEALPPSMLALVAFLFFWRTGRLIEERWINYQRHGNWAVAGIATVAGLAVLFVLLKVTGDVAGAAGFAGQWAQPFQMGMIALYVTAIAPALFRATRLGW